MIIWMISVIPLVEKKCILNQMFVNLKMTV